MLRFLVSQSKLIPLVAGMLIVFAVGCWFLFFSKRPRRQRMILAVSCFGLGMVLLGGAGAYKLSRMGNKEKRQDVFVVNQEITVQQPEDIRTAKPVDAGENEWRWWRGPHLDNHADSPSPPTEWTPDQKILWKTPLPGLGHSSPIICGDAIYVTSADDDKQTQSLIAINRSTGSLLWTRELHSGGFDKKNAKNSYASSTPACDGQKIYTVFANHHALHLSATDVTGTVVWQKEVEAYKSEHGYGASPVLFKSVVIVAAEGEDSRVFTAFDRSTGDVQWKSRFAAARVNYATPIIATVEGNELLIIPGSSAVQAMDPITGNLLWSSPWDVLQASNTIACGRDRLVASGVYPKQNMVCVEFENGQPKEVWRSTTNCGDVPTPLLVDDLLFVVTDNGVATCLDAATGKRLGIRRLGGNVSSSPLLAGGHIYVPNEDGKVFVLSADKKLEILATNEMGEPIYASPIACNNEIFLRTTSSLYCVSSSPKL